MRANLVTILALAVLVTLSTAGPLSAQPGPPLAPKGPPIVGPRPDNIILHAAEKSPYGHYLTNQRGHALYMYTSDSKGQSRCTGPCAEAWPPAFSADEPKAGKGVDPAKVGSIERTDTKGKLFRHVTYNGWPLYYYKVDGETASTSGQGVFSYDGFWYLVSPAGEPIKAPREGVVRPPG